uniref:Calx-beta domain-containing protein n=1 Tax=Rhabdothermincola sediminis TaxID=2751370 RepID=UPI0027DA54D1
MSWRKKLASLSAFALVATGLVVGVTVGDAGAAIINTDVTTNLRCVANAPVIGATNADQALTLNVTYPDKVEQGVPYTTYTASPPTVVPTNVSGQTVNFIKNLTVKTQLPPTGATVNSVVAVPGTGTWTPPGGSTVTLTQSASPSGPQFGLTYDSLNKTILLSLPGYPPGTGSPNSEGWKAGGTLQPPQIQVNVTPTGAPGTYLESKFAGTIPSNPNSFPWPDPGFTTTANIASYGDAPTYCAPYDPRPYLTRSRIIPLDTQGPEINVISPAEGGSYFKGIAVNANYSCSEPDDQVGVASCVGTVASGTPFDTSSSPGPKTFVVTATDTKGNVSTKVVNYTIVASPDPLITVSAGTATEGGSIPFQVSLSKPPENPVSVQFATADGTATSGDYTASSGTLNWSAGSTALTQTINVPTTDDTLYEGPETVMLTLSNPTNSLIDSGAVSTPGTIIDNDAPPVRVEGGSVTEGPGASVTFTLTPTAPSPVPFSVSYTTAGGTATAGSDFTTTSGTTTSWGVNDLTPTTVTVPVLDDPIVEGDETFTLDVTQYDSSVTSATGTIIDNDPEGSGPYDFTQPGVAISDLTVVEGDSGDSTVTVGVRLDKPAVGTVTVGYRTIARSATGGVDFGQKFGTVTFQNGQQDKTIPIKVYGDTDTESDEYFIVELRNPVGTNIIDDAGVVTILDDDSPTQACCVVSVADVSVWEADNVGGLPITANVDLILNQPATSDMTVKVMTAPGTATGLDFVNVNTTVKFKAGQDRKTVKIDIRPDNLKEGDEEFYVNLSNPTGGLTIGDSQGVVTILDDDHQPGAPTDLQATPDTERLGGVHLTWTPPSIASPLPALPITGHQVRVSTDGVLDTEAWISIGTTPAFDYDCGGSGAACLFEVRAVNQRGPGAAAQLATNGYADTTAPTVLIQRPYDGINVDSWGGAVLTYTGTVSTALGDAGTNAGPPATVQVRVLDSGNTPVQTFTGTITDGTFSATAPASITTPGLYTVEVSQTDWDGNVGVDTIGLQVRDAVFVGKYNADGTAATDANPGTAAQPKLTVAAGLLALGSRPELAVGYGIFSEASGGLSLLSNKAIRGGFNSFQNWTRPGSAGLSGAPVNFETRIDAAGQAALADADTNVVIDGLTLFGRSTGLPAGSNVYGLRAINGSTVTVVNSQLKAADGVQGAQGAPGADYTGTIAKAANGVNGVDCFWGCSPNPAPGGTGRNGSLGSANRGGNGGTGRSNGDGGTGEQGFTQTIGLGGRGGIGGSKGANPVVLCIGAPQGGAGGPGDGGAGGAGADVPGAGGSATVYTAGTTWTGDSGQQATGAGASGYAGHGGGGGGGGGSNCGGNQRAGSGGGGGGGNAGGGPGFGGGPGGGSFGLYAHNSTVTLDADSRAEAGAGG